VEVVCVTDVSKAYTASAIRAEVKELGGDWFVNRDKIIGIGYRNWPVRVVGLGGEMALCPGWQERTFLGQLKGRLGQERQNRTEHPYREPEFVGSMNGIHNKSEKDTLKMLANMTEKPITVAKNSKKQKTFSSRKRILKPKFLLRKMGEFCWLLALERDSCFGYGCGVLSVP
jgi:hypothetical protein